MTEKLEDIELEERWPIIPQLMPIAMVVMMLFFGYEGFLIVTGNRSWPLSIFPPVTPVNYDQYVKNRQQSDLMGQLIIGSLFLILTGWVGVKLTRLNKRKAEEVEEKK